MATSNKIKYQVGGSLNSEDPSYVERQADAKLYDALKQGEFCYVLNSRQMGKSSLLVRTMHRLIKEEFKCVAVDMTSIGSKNITPVQWYNSFIGNLWSSFKLPKKNNLKTWLKECSYLSEQSKLSFFIEELLQVHFPNEQLFIFIDEIDSILNLDFSVDDFFALIRFCYNQRAINPSYKRVTFAIFGVATPSDLIKAGNRTPFNIGQAIELRGFEEQEALPLIQGLGVTNTCGREILKEILAWTFGQAFLTQKLCKLVASSIPNDINQVEVSSVETIVRKQIIEQWESQDEPEHLRTISNRIQHGGKSTVRMLGIYQKILQEVPVKTDDSLEQIQLLLSGLVVKKQGFLKVKNPIYSEVFNLIWVEKQLNYLRPYSQFLEAWVASQAKDKSRLLRGQALEEALAWALGKSLSDLDYQYLAASQELSKQEAENAFLSLEQANQILLFARRKAKQECLKYKICWAWTGVTALCVTSLIILLGLTGFLQGMEWNALDNFFRWRTAESPDERIVIVTIDEADITKIGQWPVPDKLLTKALENIKANNPRVIGFDLYRNLPVEPGNKNLLEIYKSTPNLIGIEKVIDSRILPPEILKQSGQIGFADLILDADGKIRRGLLTFLHNNQIYESFGLKIALSYLKAEGITPKQIDKYRVQLGRDVFKKFDTNDGGYVQADAGGYQILLNFRGLLNNFQTISFTNVLENRIPPNLMASRMILIGIIAESLNDLHYTPYSSSLSYAPRRTPGVVIHANLISHLVSAALDGRPTLQVLTEPQEWFWMLLWSLLGAVLTWKLKSLQVIIASILLASVVLLFIAYQSFLQGWWLPFVPSSLGLLFAAITINIIINKKLEKIQIQQILKLLLEESATNSTAVRIAIEYLKQSESKKNQIVIKQWLIKHRK
ncbi:MAG: CHASE2 domain-containing protein [Scytonematopsis contorta HA4267-MV1]|jgi:CHASE2 domain-containing sensor protein|nr:CHASE2 domain-containing protein [Scytonematopsis contorta HA4267-MV1]